MSVFLSLLLMGFSFLAGYLIWGMHTALILLAVAMGVSILWNFATESVAGFFISLLLLIPGVIFLIGFLISGVQGGLIAWAVAMGITLWIAAARFFFKD